MRSVQRGITSTFIVLIILGTAIALTFVYFTSYEFQKQKASGINSFEDCAKHYPVMESYPEQCQTSDGKHFTRELPNEKKERLNLSASSTTLPDETTDWQAYVNTSYGYEIKFPSTWITEENKEYDFIKILPDHVAAKDLEIIEKDNPFFSEPNILISIETEPFVLPGPPDSYGLYLTKPTIMKVNNLEGVYFHKICAPDCGPEFEYPYDGGDKILHMSLGSLGKDYLEILKGEFNTNIQDIDCLLYTSPSPRD